MKIKLPFNDIEKYPLTQRFGVGFMYAGKSATHKGVDYGLPSCTILVAPFAGVVMRVTPERETGYGKSVYIRAKDESKGVIIALVAHMSHISVEVGYKLQQGQRIGLSGRSGFWRGRNGYHVHFGLEVNSHYVDPLPLLRVKVNQESSLLYDDDHIKSFLGDYVVQKGDSLWGIAEKYYGVGGHFMEIFHVNQDIIKIPNLIHPGQILRIPALKNQGI